MFDMLISLYERMINFAVDYGPRRQRKRAHREAMRNNEVYHRAYREAFRGGVSADRAWGQIIITLLAAAACVASAIFWIWFTFVEHNQFSSVVAAIGFWITLIVLVRGQLSYYRKFQNYAIEEAQKAAREDKVAKAKALADARKAEDAKRALEKSERDAKQAAGVKKAKEARKTAEKRAGSKPAQPAPDQTKSDGTGLSLEGFRSPFS